MEPIVNLIQSISGISGISDDVKKNLIKTIESDVKKTIETCTCEYIQNHSNENAKSILMSWNFEDLQKCFNFAIENDNVEILKIIIEIGNDKYDPGANHNILIRCASKRGYTEIVELLLRDNRVDPASCDNDAIEDASRYGHTEVVKLLLKDSRINPTTKHNYAIRMAATGHIEVVKVLLQDERVNPADYDNYAIRESLKRGRTEIVKLLINDSRIDIYFDDSWLPKELVNNKNFEILFTCERFDINFCDNYAIRNCLKTSNMEILKKILEDPRTHITSEELRLQIITFMNPSSLISSVTSNTSNPSNTNAWDLYMKTYIKNYLKLSDIVGFMKKGEITRIDICSQTDEATFTKKC